MMTFEVLGANATAPTREGASSSYLVTTDSGVLLVDAGPGSLMAFVARHDLDELRGIVVTHLHADHSLDLMAWAYRWTFPTVLPRIPLYIPAGETQKIVAFDELFGIPTLPPMKTPIQGSFAITELPMDGKTAFTIDGTELVSYAARHAVPSAALRFTRAGKSLALSSDTGDCAGLREAATGVDLFVAEATYLEPDEEAMAAHGHLTPALAGQIAAEVGARRLVLTHLSLPGDAAASRDRATASFGASVEVAVPGLTVSL